jgi:hypothetical protein
MEHNRSLKMMEKINNIIDWSEIEAVLLKHYTVGTTIEGADAYPPLMLMKALLLHLNHIEDGVMRKDTKSTKLTDYEKERNKQISKRRYIVEQYFGLSHLYNNAFRTRFTRIAKNAIDVLFRQMAFNLFRGDKILGTV